MRALPFEQLHLLSRERGGAGVSSSPPPPRSASVGCQLLLEGGGVDRELSVALCDARGDEWQLVFEYERDDGVVERGVCEWQLVFEYESDITAERAGVRGS